MRPSDPSRPQAERWTSMGAVAGDPRRAATHTVAAAPCHAAPLPILDQDRARVRGRPSPAAPHPHYGRMWAQPSAPRRRQAAAAPPPSRAFRRAHHARGEKGPRLCTHERLHTRAAAGRSAGSGAARLSQPRPHRGPHRGQPHRQPPDRLRLASGEPSPTAGHGGPRPQLGSGDPVRPVGWEGFSFN
jgi:hypothetical protein